MISTAVLVHIGGNVFGSGTNAHSVPLEPVSTEQVLSWVADALSDVLSPGEADLRDVDHATVHGYLSVGLLVCLKEYVPLEDIQRAVARAVSKVGLTVECRQVDEDEYTRWVTGHELPDYSLTLLTDSFSARQLREIVDVIKDHQLHIFGSHRLSLPGGLEALPAPVCMEFKLTGALSAGKQLRHDLLSVSDDIGLDLAFQLDDANRKLKRLAVFDMDSTLIQVEVIDELAARAGVGEKVSAITEKAMRGEIDFQQSFRERMALLKGLPASVIGEICESLPLMDGAERLFRTLNRYGVKTAIISGGFTPFAETLKQKLGIDWVFANTLEIKDGELTGEAILPIVDAERKANILSELAEREGIDLDHVVAVGDGANDLQMLEVAGMGIAFRAKPLVKSSSKLAISNFGFIATTVECS